MTKTLTALSLLLPALLSSSCSKLPGFSDCNEAVKNNLLQESVEKSLQAIKPTHPLEIGFCFKDVLRDTKNPHCDFKLEVSDVKEVAKNSFTSSCKANVRYSATLRMADYQKVRQEEINAVNAKASSDVAQAKDYATQTFERFGVAYSEADLKEGIAKREATVRATQEEALGKIRPEQPKHQGYFMVIAADYTVSMNKDFVNLNLDDMTLIAEGE